ncbi:hypothetical protein HA133_01775 [Mycobacteroides chelonae]|uniref:hypothetical protein n=1 Tax=Mycobacteroides chelonae TaxID=1774 RepID=UPI0018B08436|nr:hypothetical protein [Mycobacteroides chelonae]MBF9434664.1 hypothetical protein [Mycobacteroides chelonae]
MEPGSSAIAALKEAMSLKLETPFFLLSSLVGLLAVFVHDATPLQAIARGFTWVGWEHGGAWVEPSRRWLTDSVHLPLVHLVFGILAVAGVGLAAHSPRPPFFAWLGIAGLVEIGASADAWRWPLLAFVTTSLIGRMRERRDYGNRWQHAELTMTYLVAACAYIPIFGVIVFLGERQRPEPATVKMELTHDAQRALDKRLNAFGMPPLVKPVAREMRTFVHRPIPRIDPATAKKNSEALQAALAKARTNTEKTECVPISIEEPGATPASGYASSG